MIPEHLAAMRDEALKAQAANDEALAALARRGIQVDATAMTATRLAFLLNTLLGDFDGDHVTAARVQYELRVQERVTAMIAEINSQVARQMLLQGVSGQVPR